MQILPDFYSSLKYILQSHSFKYVYTDRNGSEDKKKNQTTSSQSQKNKFSIAKNIFSIAMLSLVVCGVIAVFANQLLDEGKQRLVNYVFDKLYPGFLNMMKGSGCAMHLRERPHGKYIAWREEDIEKLKKEFDSFEESEEVVNVVYLVGVPGSGKTELARQFGKSMYCKRNGAPVVVTLNIENLHQLKMTLGWSIWHIEEASQQHSKDIESLLNTEVDVLFHQLKELLKKRPRWLLIIDNVRVPNVIQKDMYQQLPIPGPNERWGTGKMLITAQSSLVRDRSYGRYFRTLQNTGLTLPDATNFLRELVNESSRCDATVINKIVEKLELLPLSIVAASESIRSEMKTSTTYRCGNCLSEYSAAFSILSAQNRTVAGYNLSLLAALNLTIMNTLEVHSKVYHDFIALIGFTTVDRRTIRVEHVKGYLTKMGHTREQCEKILDFPLVYFSETKQVFRVHQVVSHAFREAVNQINTDEALQRTLQSISHYFAVHHKSDFRSSYEIEHHYVDLLQSLPTRCTYLDTCLIAPYSEDLGSVITVLFSAYPHYSRYHEKPDCSKLDTFLDRLRSAPVYRNRILVQLEFRGYQALSICYSKSDRVDGSYLAATIALRLIKEVAPAELHTIPASWFLLNLNSFPGGESLYNHVTFFLLFPHYLKFPYNTDEIRRKLCLSLNEIARILFPRQAESVRQYCNPDFNDVERNRELIDQDSSYRDFFYSKINRYRPFIRKRHTSLTTNIWFASENVTPYGKCTAENKVSFSGSLYIGALKFCVGYGERVDRKTLDMTVHKYRSALVFFEWVDKKHMQLNWRNSSMNCQSIKDELMTELQKPSVMKTSMKSFHEKLLLFADNYCASFTK